MPTSDSSKTYLDFPAWVASDVADFSHLLLFDSTNGARLYRQTALIDRIEQIRSVWNQGELKTVCTLAEQLEKQTVAVDNMVPELGRGLGTVYLGCCQLRGLAQVAEARAQAETARRCFEAACGCFSDDARVPLLKGPALLGLAAACYKADDAKSTLAVCRRDNSLPT